MTQSVVAVLYEKTVDRESAHEIITARVAAMTKQAQAVKADTAAAKGRAAEESDSGFGGLLGGLFGGGSKRESAGQAMIKSAARSIGSQVGREINRGVVGSILRKR